MVKIEDHVGSEDSSDVEVIDETAFRNICRGSKPSSVVICRKEEPGEAIEVDMDTKISLQLMEFSEAEVDLAINRLGESAPLPELIDFILASRAAGNSGDDELNGSSNCVDGKNEGATGETLHEVDKIDYLLQMGFSENEVLSAIDNFGLEVPVSELMDSVFAQRISYHAVMAKEDLSNDGGNTILQNQNGFSCSANATPDDATEGHRKRCYPPSKTWDTKPSSSNLHLYDSKRLRRGKNSEHKSADNEVSSNNSHSQEARRASRKSDDGMKPSPYNKLTGSAEARLNLEQPAQMTPNLHRAASHIPSQPLYFFYGNVVEVSQEIWSKLSQFLYETEPEFTNSEFFSAFIRKEGYIHNLPTEKRFRIIPAPPMTIEDALPYTREWWPSWDTRKKLSCINSEITGNDQLCDRLEKVLIDSKGMLSKEQKVDILHQCKTMNLLWMGQNKLSPIKHDEVERILGYCKQHTDFWGAEPEKRLRALKYGFQTDTLGYHLSGLKAVYPDGLRVLSIYSGIGGAEVALDKLGIHLKLVVSVEDSENNRRILKRWWHNSRQSGILKQIGGIEMLNTKKLGNITEEFGGFDIVIGANPCAFEGPKEGSSEGVDLKSFFEFVRIFQRVRNMMKTNR